MLCELGKANWLQWRQIILRLIIIAALAITFVIFLFKLFGKDRHENVVKGDKANNEDGQHKPSILPILLFVLLMTGLVLFALPRFGISLMGLIQKATVFWPLIRGFLPF